MSANAERNAEIIRRRKAGEWPRAIARAMGLSHNAVIGVCNRAGLSGAAGKAEVLRGEYTPRATLSDAQVAEARSRYKPRSPTDGLQAMATEWGVPADALKHAVALRTWKHVA